MVRGQDHQQIRTSSGRFLRRSKGGMVRILEGGLPAPGGTVEGSVSDDAGHDLDRLASRRVG